MSVARGVEREWRWKGLATLTPNPSIHDASDSRGKVDRAGRERLGRDPRHSHSSSVPVARGTAPFTMDEWNEEGVKGAQQITSLRHSLRSVPPRYALSLGVNLLGSVPPCSLRSPWVTDEGGKERWGSSHPSSVSHPAPHSSALNVVKQRRGEAARRNLTASSVPSLRQALRSSCSLAWPFTPYGRSLPARSPRGVCD